MGSRTPRLASIEEPTIKAYVTEIKNEQGTAMKVIQNAKYRLGMIDTLLPQISAALAAKNKPTGPVLTSLVNKTLNLVSGVDEIVGKLDSSFIIVNVALNTLEAYKVSNLVNPEDFKEDIIYTRKSLKYKINDLTQNFLIKKQEIENIQSLISMTEARSREIESTGSSRNSSPARQVIRSNADSMKPQVLTYAEATVTLVSEHMLRVNDWISNMFPNGHSFLNYKTNFNSTLDKEFSLKANRFNSCKTEEDMLDMMNQLMELKYPIHLRRIDALNPNINSNEEASSMLKRMVVTFNEAKMAQSHWENNLLHLFLKHLPESEVFRKQKEWVSNYLSELSNKGANTRADLAKSKRQIQWIEAELRQNNKPTSQSANNRNRRAKQDEKQEARCGICNQYGHTKENCKSPCWHCQLPGHRNRDCPKRGERGRSKSRGRERGRNNSTSQQRGQSSKRRKHSPYPKRKGKKKGSKNNRTRNDSPSRSG